MNHFFKICSILMLGFFSQTLLAAPSFLVTHNHTDVESNAFIGGTIKSPYPTKAHTDNSVSWTAVRIACIGHTSNNKCKALIKMATDTANAVDLGWLELDLSSGDIDPKVVQGNGYTLVVNKPGEVTLSKE